MSSFFRSTLIRILLLAGCTGAVAQAAGSSPSCCQKSTAACCSSAKDCCQPAVAAAYPLDTCVVSGDKLEDGDMGPPIDYIYKQAGQADRLVRFCCESCIKTFNKDPQKYLKLIDAATQAQGEKPAGAASAGR